MMTDDFSTNLGRPGNNDSKPFLLAPAAAPISSGAPPGHEKSPVSVACCRALGTNRTDLEPPLTEATGAASVRPVIDVPAASFPPCKAESTLAARLALIGFELRRAELGGGYVVARWDRGTQALADLAAVAAFADQEGAPT